jgi:hypothetical protein
MSCETFRHELTERLESGRDPRADEPLGRHPDECAACRGAAAEYQAVRARLAASAGAAARPALEDRVMAQLPSRRTAAGAPDVLSAWFSRAALGARAWRLGLGTLGVAILVVAVAVVVSRQPSQAWSMKASIEATRPFRALHLRGSFAGNADSELWARSSSDGARSQRLLIHIGRRAPILVWTEGNATYTYDPGRRTVYTDDAQTAGFNPWPGPKLFAMAQAAGVRVVDSRWRFPGHRRVVVEWSLLGGQGPTSARAEFDLETKLLVALTQWDNMDQRGVPAFASDDITYLPDLPDEVFRVNLPAGVAYVPKPIDVKESLLGLLALGDAGIPTPSMSIGEAGRRIVTEMWQTLMARDVAGFKRLCPAARTWSDDLVSVLILGRDGDPDAVVEVVAVEPGVARGHSALGPVSVVTSRVRRRDGGLYEEKIIVQHRPGGPEPSCVIYMPYGQPYRLE